MHRDGVSASDERVLLQGIDYHGFFGASFREDDHHAGSPLVSRIRLEVEALLRRDVEELMEERGVCVCHSTIHRWPMPDLANSLRCLRTNSRSDVGGPENVGAWSEGQRPNASSKRAGIKVRGKWKYLYRAVDAKGNTVDFLLTAKRDHKAAKNADLALL